jgi:carboxymethylenebutenolidase
MVEEETRVRTADGEMPTFVVHPDGAGPFPVAVLYMDGIGYREQVKENARRFAADGYYCVAPDLFYRSGDGLTFDMEKLHVEGMQGPYGKRLMEVVARVTPERAVADTEAIFAAIESDSAAGSGPKVCVGYCMGARVALHVASVLSDAFVAAAGIHPGALGTDQPDSPITISRVCAASCTSHLPRSTTQRPRRSSPSARASWESSSGSPA